PGRAPLFQVGDFLLTEFQLAAGPVAADPSGEPRPPRPVRFAGATEDYTAKGRSAAMAIDGVTDPGWSVKGGVGKDHAAVFALAEDVGQAGGIRLVVTLHQEYIHQTTIGRFRLSAATDACPRRG